MPKLTVLAGTLLLLLVACAPNREAFLAGIPERPDLSTAHPELVQRISEAETRVRSGEEPLEGVKALARLYHANGFLNQAVISYDVLLREEPNNPRWPHLLGFIIAGYGKLEVSLPLWERVMELEPDYIPAQLRYADALLKLNRMEEAEAAYRQILDTEANNGYARLGMARIAITNDNYADARAHLELATEVSNNRIGYDLLVNVYEQLGETDKAVALRSQKKASGAFADIADPWLNAIMDDCYDPYQLVSAGGMAEFMDNEPRGVELYKRALDLAPQDRIANYHMGNYHRRHGRGPEAIAYYEVARTTDTEFADAWLSEIDTYRKMGREREADRLLFTALEACPDSASLNLEMGKYYARNNAHEHAIRAYRKSIELRPNEPDAYMMLAVSHFRSGRMQDGIEQVKDALNAEPGYPLALTTLVNVYIQLGDEAASREWMQAVMNQPRIPPNDLRQIQARYRQAFGPLPPRL